MNQNHEHSPSHTHLSWISPNLDNINGHFRKNASINLYQEKKKKNKVPTLTEKCISLFKIHQDLIDEIPRFQVCLSKITTIQ